VQLKLDGTIRFLSGIVDETRCADWQAWAGTAGEVQPGRCLMITWSLSLSLSVCVFVSVFSKPGAKMQWIELEGTLLVTTSTNENGPTVRQNKRKHFYLCFRTFF